VKRELLEPVFRLVNHDAGAGWIHGLTDPAKAFVLARLRVATGRACVVVFPRRS